MTCAIAGEASNRLPLPADGLGATLRIAPPTATVGAAAAPPTVAARWDTAKDNGFPKDQKPKDYR